MIGPSDPEAVDVEAVLAMVGIADSTTLQLVVERSREGLARQFDTLGRLDGKALGVGEVAGGLIGLAGVANVIADPGLGALEWCLLGIALGSFLGCLALAGAAVRPRAARSVDRPGELAATFADAAGHAAGESFVAMAAAAYDHNERIERTKARLLGLALISLGVEAAAIFAAGAAVAA